MNERIKEEINVNGVCNFSIDHILNRAGQNTCSSFQRKECSSPENGNSGQSSDFHEYPIPFHDEPYRQYTFQWLNCSRYHPPKLPRGHKKEGAKRQPGRHPRIPFTPFQMETLERSYKCSPYLCPNEVYKLSKMLELTETRIKIWFQNRRAREKREKDTDSNCCNE